MAKKKEPSLFALSLLKEMRFAVIDEGSEEEDVFKYEKVEKIEEKDGCVWTVKVDRRDSKLYSAELLFEVNIKWNSGQPDEGAIESVIEAEMDKNADITSHILSTLTYSAFMRPIITPPYYDGVVNAETE